MNTPTVLRFLGEEAEGLNRSERELIWKGAEEIESLTMAKERLREELMYARALLQDQYCDLTSIDKALEETE